MYLRELLGVGVFLRGAEQSTSRHLLHDLRAVAVYVLLEHAEGIGVHLGLEGLDLHLVDVLLVVEVLLEGKHGGVERVEVVGDILGQRLCLRVPVDEAHGGAGI